MAETLAGSRLRERSKGVADFARKREGEERIGRAGLHAKGATEPELDVTASGNACGGSLAFLHGGVRHVLGVEGSAEQQMRVGIGRKLG